MEKHKDDLEKAKSRNVQKPTPQRSLKKDLAALGAVFASLTAGSAAAEKKPFTFDDHQRSTIAQAQQSLPDTDITIEQDLRGSEYVYAADVSPEGIAQELRHAQEALADIRERRIPAENFMNIVASFEEMLKVVKEAEAGLQLRDYHELHKEAKRRAQIDPQTQALEQMRDREAMKDLSVFYGEAVLDPSRWPEYVKAADELGESEREIVQQITDRNTELEYEIGKEVRERDERVAAIRKEFDQYITGSVEIGPQDPLQKIDLYAMNAVPNPRDMHYLSPMAVEVKVGEILRVVRSVSGTAAPTSATVTPTDLSALPEIYASLDEVLATIPADLSTIPAANAAGICDRLENVYAKLQGLRVPKTEEELKGMQPMMRPHMYKALQALGEIKPVEQSAELDVADPPERIDISMYYSFGKISINGADHLLSAWQTKKSEGEIYVQIIPALPKSEASSIETLLDQRFRTNNDGSGSSSILIGYGKESGDQRKAMKRFYGALEKAGLASRGMTDDSSD